MNYTHLFQQQSRQTIAIQAFGLSTSLGGRMVLHDVNLQVAVGECVALVGDNGSGKTTLLRSLAGIVRPGVGEVRWFGRPVAASPSRRHLIGMVAHESWLYAEMTLRENLCFAARMYAVRDVVRRVNALLDRAGLRQHADRQVQQVSRGMRQRLALARALIHDPPILLLDEPFTGLDTTGREWLITLLARRERRRAICLATHNVSHVRQLADRVVELNEGLVISPPGNGQLSAAREMELPRAA